MYFDIHKHFLGPDHVASKAADAGRMLKTSHYDSKRKGWDWDKYVTFHKEQHVIIECLTDYCYSVMDNGTKVHHIKSNELETVVNVVWERSVEKISTQCPIWAK